MQRHVLRGALAIFAVGVLLGATVFRQQVAHAAAFFLVREQNTDANGNIKVHEQGTAKVEVDSTANTSKFQQMTISAPAGQSTANFLTEPINASLITVAQDTQTFKVQWFYNNSVVLDQLGPASGFNVSSPWVIPLTQPIAVDRVDIICSNACSSHVVIAGS